MTKVIAEGITNWPAENTQLIGSNCPNCGMTTFPVQEYCPKCCQSGLHEVLLPRTGTLVTWTTQNFHPGEGYPVSAADFTPFNMGLIQLGDVIKVEGRLTETDTAKIQFGMNLEMTIIPLGTDETGEELLTFAFSPA